MKKFPNYLLVGEQIDKQHSEYEKVTISASFEKEQFNRKEQLRIENTEKTLENIKRTRVFKPSYVPKIVSYKKKLEDVSYQEILNELSNFDDLLYFDKSSSEQLGNLEDVNVTYHKRLSSKKQMGSNYTVKKNNNLSFNTILDKELMPNIFKK